MLNGWKKVADRPLRILYWLPYLLTVVITLFLILYWKHIPAQVPQHWNSAGVIDDYADAGSYICLLIFLYFMLAWHALFIVIIPSFCGKENLFGKHAGALATDADVTQGTRFILYLLMWIDLLMAFMFAYIILCGVFLCNLGAWFLPVTIGVMIIDIIYYLWRLYRLSREIALR